VSRRLWVLDLGLVALAGVFAWTLYHEAGVRRPLPPPQASRPPSATTPEAGTTPRTARPDSRALANTIAGRNLFSPSRSEAPAGAPTAQAQPGPKPLLHGVVLDDGRSRAYIEDPTTKRVFGYALGDQVAGGRLEAIRDDRVVIARPGGQLEVLLRDPSKPKPAPPAMAPGAAAPTPAARPPAQPGQATPFLFQPPQPGQAAPPQAPPAVTAPSPAPASPAAPFPFAVPAPGQTPRSFETISPDLFRRRQTPPPAGSQPGGG
jgi:hypothetical protein